MKKENLKLTLTPSTKAKIAGVSITFLASFGLAFGLGMTNAETNKHLAGETVYADELSNVSTTATTTDTEEITTEEIEDEVTTTEVSAWDKQIKADYYRNLYGPKIAKTVEVDGYTLDYIKGAPYSVYQEQARNIKLEEERIAEEQRRAEEQRMAEELASQQAEVAEVATYEEPSYNPPSGGCLTPTSGIYYYGNQLETYYNLDMSVIVEVAHSNGIGGEYWIRNDGCKMLGDYIMLACNRDVHPYGTLVETSLGTGISLDTGGFAAGNPYQVDIAVNW